MTPTALNVMADAPGANRLRTYIAVTFWGEEYRRYFLDYCLASLMAPDNIPAIENKRDARLLIATRQDDWDALQQEPIFIAASRHIAIEHVLHEAPLKVPYNKKMMIMSQGHKLLAQKMFADRAHGVMVYPDVIFADGAIKRIERLANSGYKVVLCIAVRFANEGLIEELKRLGFVDKGKPIVIGAEELARLTFKHMHSETVRFEFDAELDDQAACSFFWVVTPAQDLLFHCANWAPFLLDYSSVTSHDDSTFDKWTFDGDYVARNFSNLTDIYVVRDTAELFVSGFTSESKVSYRKVRLLPYRIPSLRTAMKIVRAREYMTSHGILDDVKKVFFRVPIRVRGGKSSEAAWREVENRAAKVVDRISEPNMGLAVCCFFWSIVRRCISFVLGLWRSARAAMRERLGELRA